MVFTSTTATGNVTDLAIGGTANSTVIQSAPVGQSLKVVTANGTLTTAESTSITFVDLDAGETVTVGGVTYTAPVGGASASTVALAFASLADGAGSVDANTSGTLSGFQSASASGATVVFTSTSSTTDVTDLAVTASATVPVTQLSKSEQNAVVIEGSANDGLRLVGGWQRVESGGQPVLQTINGETYAVFESNNYTPAASDSNANPSAVPLKVYVPYSTTDANKTITPGLLVTSGESGDVQLGTAGDDEYRGNGGNDSFDAGAGNDSLDAGTGNDTIAAGTGNDTVLGGTGNDVIYGGTLASPDAQGSGNDVIDSGEGNDVVYAGDGADSVTAGTGADTVYAGAGDDTVESGQD